MTLHGKTGADGVMHLSIPLGDPNAEYGVVVVMQRATPVVQTKTPEELGWPPGFFEQTAGGITDETFVRHPQGEYEKRLDFE
jgi:hypothetical protein